ncbi:LPS-assembly protein LptD [Bacteroidales bacterium OttesenSCG-928-I14]|nr:LPS-assembly protein LptD [Bacteroidales bacterium OttesenSCG-928-I14]
MSRIGLAQDIVSPILPDSISNQEEIGVLSKDSTQIKKSESPIEAPIDYNAKDSMVMILDSKNMMYLYGDGDITYMSSKLKGEYIEVDAVKSEVYSTFGLDSIGEEFGYPVFSDGGQEYEIKEVKYNFKTKKLFSRDIITQQGEGYMTAKETKMMPNQDMYMRGGVYTTCDHEHPHFYLKISKAKMRPGKDVIFGFSQLVIEDVPMPIALPFGFFPFTDDYSSGVIMPTYGDEMKRGFSLRDGGYYFAFNDYVDLALTGEIYTKGSWGLQARSNYKKRYKFNGSLDASYIVTKLDETQPVSKDFRLNWRHAQDAKAHPFRTFSADVRFSTSGYGRNNLSEQYSGGYSNNTKASTVNYSYRFPNSPFSMSMTASINQTARDTTLSITLPSLTITMRDIYPFKRKEQIGDPKWYENIRMSYSGQLSNSITAKEYDIFEKNIIKDWKNGMKHYIPISASFNLFKYINVTPSLTYNEKWYTSKRYKAYDSVKDRIVDADTVYGFYRIYDFSGSISASTKLYGMYKPWKIFGEWTKNTVIRHVLTPKISFSGSPNFSDFKYGYYTNLRYYDGDGKLVNHTYSPFNHNIYGVPGTGMSGSLNFGFENNIEMKIPMAKSDSVRKISLIDNLGFNMGYNFLADSMNWTDIRTTLRIKLLKNLTLNLSGDFDTYTYNENGTRINVPRWKAGKGLGRLRGTGTSFSYSINTNVIKGWFNKDDKSSDGTNDNGVPGIDESLENDVGDEDIGSGIRRKKKKVEGEGLDADGYWIPNIPWNLTLSYSISFAYDMANFDKVKREYPYKFNQTLGISGNISPTKGWSFNFSTNYDFDAKKFSTMNCSIVREMHCWQMSASFIPIGPYQSYHFSIAVSSSLLQDLKYNQSGSHYDALKWGD